jgi:hypothetical protein
MPASRSSSGAWGSSAPMRAVARRTLVRTALVPCAIACAIACALAARRADAQSPDHRRAALADTTPRIRLCDLRTVTAIDIKAQYPDIGGIERRSRLLANLVQDLHAVTRDEVVRRVLVLRVGDRCSELRRAESERLLRAQPFLADARVVARDDGSGGVRLEVVTYDELSLVAGVATGNGAHVTGVKLGNRNLSGEAIEVQTEWRSGGFYRDLFSGRVVDYQILGRPYQMMVEGARRPQGSDWLAELTHPYFTDLQRIAWRVTGGEVETYLGMLRRGPEPSPSLGVTRRFWDAGGILRIGMPGRLSLFGASVSSESERPAFDPVIVSDTGIVLAGDSVARALAGRWTSYRVARVNALWGVRNVRFLRVTGFDALRGPQDVRIGFQFGTLFGRSLPVMGSDDDDIFVASDIYVANGSRRSFLALQARAEGREDGDTRRWDGVLTSGRLAWYLRTAAFNTVEASAEWSGGWRTRVPFQVSFADIEGGVRGYRDSRLAGAQRAVLRLEDRLFLGTVKQSADVGLAMFTDVGRLWAGDAAFGVDARPHLGAGLGLLVAVPPRSKRLWRLDVARAITSDPDAKWEVRLTSGDFTRAFWRDPPDVRRVRERTVPQSVFTWP